MTSAGSHWWGLKVALLALVLSVSVERTSAQNDTTPRPLLLITPRFNSSGYFPFTGAMLNHNLNFDINIFYEHKGNGFFVFKSADLQDKHSYINYLQPGVFRKFQFAPKFQLGIFFGYLFSQTTGFHDKDSDIYSAAVAYWTISDRLKLENTMLFFDLTQSGKMANRLLISYGLSNFKFDFYLWHRWVFDESSHATSISLALTAPPVKVTKSLEIKSTISYMGYISEEKPDYALPGGFLVSVAFPLTLTH
jgi:hypothetical protein